MVAGSGRTANLLGSFAWECPGMALGITAQFQRPIDLDQNNLETRMFYRSINLWMTNDDYA